MFEKKPVTIGKLPTIASISLLLIFTACEPVRPDVTPGLEPVTVAFAITPDSRYLSVGDTISFSASATSVQPNGTDLKNSVARVGFDILRRDSLFAPDSTLKYAENGSDMIVLSDTGNIVYYTDPNRVLGIDVSENNSKYVYRFKIVLKKKGLFVFNLLTDAVRTQSGNTQTESGFNVQDAHWSFRQLADTPEYGADGYNTIYHVGIK